MFELYKYSANVTCYDNCDAIVYLNCKFLNKEIIICHYSQQHCMKRYRQQSSEDVQSPARHEIARFGYYSVAVTHKRRTLPIKYATSSFALGTKTGYTCLQPNAVFWSHSLLRKTCNTSSEAHYARSTFDRKYTKISICPFVLAC